MKREALARICDAQRQRYSLVVVTRLDDGAQCLLDAKHVDGELLLSPPQVAEARRLMSSGRSTALPGADGLFARAYVPLPRLLIIGAVHITQALAPMAGAAGFDVIVIDPRSAFASAERFPGVQLAAEWPDEALARLPLDAATALVTLSHDPKLDDPALELALPSPVFYIGALGSRRTHEKRLDRLQAAGLGSLVSRIHSPIGLDLGGRSAAEIAVAILAEIIHVRYRGDRVETGA
jgi:xanthine dehydrogenase accessory factor